MSASLEPQIIDQNLYIFKGNRFKTVNMDQSSLVEFCRPEWSNHKTFLSATNRYQNEPYIKRHREQFETAKRRFNFPFANNKMNS